MAKGERIQTTITLDPAGLARMFAQKKCGKEACPGINTLYTPADQESVRLTCMHCDLHETISPDSNGEIKAIIILDQS